MKRRLAALVPIAFALLASAQPGALDPTFNPVGFGSGAGANGAIRSVAVQPDGKVIIGGAFTTYNGTAHVRIARLNADGSQDPTFDPGTGANGDVWCTTVQADGKIIIGGNFTTYNGTARARIARLNADGSLDDSFDPGSGANLDVYSTHVQADGKVIIGGAFSNYNGSGANFIVRLNADGTLDASFSPGTRANETVYSIAVQADGKIIIGGVFTTYNGTGRNHIARLNADGSLDATFDLGSGADEAVRSIALQADGKIIIGGWLTTYNGTARNRIARLNADGTLDTGFNPGTGADNVVRTITAQADGKIIIGGQFTTYNGMGRNYIARLNADGSLDTDLGSGANNWVWTTTVQADGKIIMGGDFTTYNGTARNRVTRLNTDGTLDATFNVSTGANNWVRTTSVQADGKIIIGGDFTTYNDTIRNRIARLNADGTLDATFTPGTGASAAVWSTAVQADGKFIVVGAFTTYNGTGRNRIARLNTDGTLDNTFNVGTGANNSILHTAVQADGKFIIAGSFTGYNGTGRNRIARLNADGSLDAAFDPGAGANDNILFTAVDADGKIIIGGSFTNYNGTGRNRIVRLNADGSLDTSFNPGTGASSSVRSIVVQADGKIIIGGDFSHYNGTIRNHIARLNADGSLDATFNPGSGANNPIYSIAVQADGKFIIGGAFTTYNGTGRNRMARLNTDGSLDATFNPGTGVSSLVYSTALQTDGKIIIGGQFTSYNGTGRNRVARVLGSGYDCPALEANIGAACDDGDPCTTNDTVDASCGCSGTALPDSDDDGTCDTEDDCPLAAAGIANFNTSSCGCNAGYYPVLATLNGNTVITACSPCAPVAGCMSAVLCTDATDSQCTECAIGFYLDNGICTPCPAGSYCPDGVVRNLCPPGSFSSMTGTMSCMLCAANTYSPEPGATACLDCPDGATSLVGSMACSAPTCTENVTVELRTDANSAQASWQILAQHDNTVLCQFTVPVNGITTPITENCCLPVGCYRLRVLDSGGDGFVTGGYQLRESGPNGRRIIDNLGNFTSGSSSAIGSAYENGAFCLPVGDDRLIFSSCDKVDWVANKFIVATENTAVSAQFGVANATSGYEFWFYDPNGSYSFRRFRSHATSDGYGTGALRANHFKVNGWTNSIATPHIPANTMLNVRIRGRVAGTNLPFGQACLFKIDATLATCPRVKLQDNPTNPSDFSCGVSRNFGGTSNANNRIYANPPQPVPTVASSSVRYQFRFRIPGENICIVRPPQTSARMVLNWTNGPTLQCSRTYEVDVRVSLNGGATWCFGPTGSSQAAACADTEDWGKVCSVTINPCAQPNGGGNSMALEGGNSSFTLYPNPNGGEQLFVSITGVEEARTASVDIYDLTGKRVVARSIAVADGFVKANIDLQGQLSSGVYVVHITAGSKTHTERLVIAH